MRLYLLQVPVTLDGIGEIFWVSASVNMAVYAIEMTPLEVNGNLDALQPDRFPLFCENDVIMKYEVEQSSIDSLSFIVFYYYLEKDADTTHYTTSNASFHAGIKMLQSCFILYDDSVW